MNVMTVSVSVSKNCHECRKCWLLPVGEEWDGEEQAK